MERPSLLTLRRSSNVEAYLLPSATQRSSLKSQSGNVVGTSNGQVNSTSVPMPCGLKGIPVKARLPTSRRKRPAGRYTEKPMTVTRLQQDDSGYPPTLHEYLGDRAPATLAALGNWDILRQKKLALFCSVKCPGTLILQTYDLACALRNAGVTVISGFHSPMEKECLALLLRGRQPVIICPARSIEAMRLPADWKVALTQGRLLLLSPFEAKLRRATTGRARTRNELVAALADALLIAHATPGGKTERFCRDVLVWGKPLLTLESNENAGLLTLGARPIRPERLSEQWGVTE